VCPTEDPAGWKDSYDYNCAEYATNKWCLNVRYDITSAQANCVQVRKMMREVELMTSFVVVRGYICNGVSDVFNVIERFLI
jgi:hypothetical protein